MWLVSLALLGAWCYWDVGTCCSPVLGVALVAQCGPRGTSGAFSLCQDLHSDEGMPATLLCKGHGLDPQIPIPFPLHKGWGVMAGTWRTLWDME